MSIVRVLFDSYRSHESGPNISIELNFWHASVLAGLLSEFEPAAGPLGEVPNGSEGSFKEGHLWNNNNASQSERALAELFLNLKFVIDNQNGDNNGKAANNINNISADNIMRC